MTEQHDNEAWWTVSEPDESGASAVKRRRPARTCNITPIHSCGICMAVTWVVGGVAWFWRCLRFVKSKHSVDVVASGDRPATESETR
jgi:hypothetical protein